MSGPQISDHALLRFFERCGGMDVEGARAGLRTSLARAHEAARGLSQSDYLITVDGTLFVVRGETVTTVLEAGPTAQHARALAAKQDRHE